MSNKLLGHLKNHPVYEECTNCNPLDLNIKKCDNCKFKPWVDDRSGHKDLKILKSHFYYLFFHPEIDKIERGSVIHHFPDTRHWIDNKENLTLLSKSEHIKEHMKLNPEKYFSKSSENGKKRWKQLQDSWENEGKKFIHDNAIKGIEKRMQNKEKFKEDSVKGGKIVHEKHPELRKNIIEVNKKYPGLPKKANCIRNRRRFNLCEKCGLNKHDGECIENYEKIDRRLLKWE